MHSCNMVSWLQLSMILVMLITQFTLSRGVKEGCQEDVYKVKVVASCPKSKIEWDIAASKKNCSKIAAVAKKKNCTIDEIQPKYHCVINALRNKLLEVCADEKRILGYCAEFNEAGRVIQNHEAAPCEKVSPNCNDAYSSLDAYKYTGCYKLVYQTTSFDIDKPESGYDEKIIITATFIAVFVLCLVGAIAMFLERRRRAKRKISRRRKWMQKKKTGTKEHQGFIKTTLDNTINKVAEEESKPFRQFLFCKASRFPHFLFVYNRIEKYKLLNKENVIPKNVIIKIEVVGEITDDNLQLLPKGKLNRGTKNNETIWEAIPLLCFQNDVSLKSAIETRSEKSACHLIFIKSGLDATGKEDDSIIVVDQNKENILKAITLCLEKPLCNILQELSDCHSECTERANEIMALKKMMLEHNEDTETPTVPDDVKKFLSERSDVVGYTMMRNSTLEVRVEKETDAMELENDLMKINSKLFKTCRLNILKRQTIKRYTCADAISFNDDEKNKIPPTSNNESTNYNRTASKGDLPVLASPKTQRVIYEKDDKSVTVRISETDESFDVKVRFKKQSTFDLPKSAN